MTNMVTIHVGLFKIKLTKIKIEFLSSTSHISGEGNVNPLWYSCLENPRDRGAWWAAIYGVAQSRTQPVQLSSSSSHISRARITACGH